MGMLTSLNFLSPEKANLVKFFIMGHIKIWEQKQELIMTLTRNIELNVVNIFCLYKNNSL